MNAYLQENEIENSINMINSMHKSVQFEGLVALRKLISVNDNPPIQEVIDSGIIPKILEIMAWEGETEFQMESSWCILSICSREEEEKFTEFLLELGALDLLINLFDSQVEGLVLHAVWAIYNIAGTGNEYRGMCLERDCISKLLRILERFPTSQNLIDHTIHGLATLCHIKPLPQWDVVLPALPVFHKHISQVSSQEALRWALWGLSFISEENIQGVIDEGCIPYLVHHLCTGSKEIMAPALRTLGNLLAGDGFQTNEILNIPEFLPRLLELTQNNSNAIRKEAFWAISNIAAGSEEQIEKILENDDYIKRLKTAVETEHLHVAEEAAWAVLNMLDGASLTQIQSLLHNHGLLRSFAPFLTNYNVMKHQVLEAILNLLQREQDCEFEIDYKKYIKEAGLVEIIKDLANYPFISSNANLILEHFPVENKEENENTQGNSNQEA